MSPSRSSRASCIHVEAHEGTMADQSDPSSRVTSTSTVGFHRESITSRAFMAAMVYMAEKLGVRSKGKKNSEVRGFS